jgi:hypothetical protein
VRTIVLVVALSIAASLARAQGTLLQTLDDVRGAPYAPTSRGVLPASIDISASLPTPGAQGDTDTCTSWAVTYGAASAALWAKNRERPVGALSPAFTYQFAGGGPFCRGPTSISRTLDVLRDTGALPLREYAFDPGWCGRQPTPKQQARAEAYRIPGWQKVDAHDLSAVKERKGGP